ncbi:MAG: hypothetical protein DRI57_23285 [Deltaproteobacteria bacterium]|nr:MAG: hypothetical protein DRI57_23285 [Deltaproteobacteria bacterium]
MNTIEINVNVGKEIFEIAKDFVNPIEVVREAIHNSYDACAKNMMLRALPQTLEDGNRVLSLVFFDDGLGMDREGLECFFGLGFHQSFDCSDRNKIGFKGHGAKIYYQAAEFFVLTKKKEGDLLLAHLPQSRRNLTSKKIPCLHLYEGQDAEEKAQEWGLEMLDSGSGTSIYLIDFTPNSSRLIEKFSDRNLENYIRWFTIFGTFEHILNDHPSRKVMELFIRATDSFTERKIDFGHNLPTEDLVNFRVLKKRDKRRPFNYFRKTFKKLEMRIKGGYTVDILAVVEGARGRAERDLFIRRQGRKGTLYKEDERYGLWLCKDYVPVEKKFEWTTQEDAPTLADIDPQRALIFVNCQEFSLTANRNSVGNSSSTLTHSVRKAVYEFIEEISTDSDLEKFSNEYREDVLQRSREKDRKALKRRIDRYNKRKECTISLSNGAKYTFLEPTREITLYGLIAHLNEIEPDILGLEILDYDDHSGIDLLVRKQPDPGNLLSRDEIAYTELKYELGHSINHSFDVLHAIVCWENTLAQDDFIQDIGGNRYQYSEAKNDITHSSLMPIPGGRLSHIVKVVVLKRLLSERYEMQCIKNPRKIK